MKETDFHFEQNAEQTDTAWQEYQEYLSGFGLQAPEPDFFGRKSRRRWNFSKATKQEAFYNQILSGEIPEGAKMSDYEGHHVIPVQAARKRGLDRSEITSASNCVMLRKKHHKQLHDHLTNDELADYAEKPRQKGFWRR